MLILADTNLILRMVEREHPDHQVAMSGVRGLAEKGYLLSLVPQVLYEFWVVATRPIEANGLGMSASQAIAEIGDLLLVFRLLRDERTIFEHWLNLVVKYDVIGKQSHDTRLVAAMQRHKISYIATFNAKDFLRFSDLVVVSPHDVLQMPKVR